MFSLVNILILFFIILICYQIILANNIIEGLDNKSSGTSSGTSSNKSSATSYQSYDTNNPSNALILAQQNAGNIEFIKQQLESVQGIDKQVQDLSGNVETLQDQVNGLIQSQQDYANQMTGGTAPEVTGTGETDETDETDETNNLATT